MGLYASFVKVLEIRTPAGDDLHDSQVVDALHQTPISTIFPNLRELTISIFVCPEDLDSFFRDSMGGLDLRVFSISADVFVDGVSEDMPTPVWKGLAAAVRGHPRLEQFTVRGSTEIDSAPWTEQQKEISSLLKDLPNLITVTLENMGESFAEQWEVASHIAGLKAAEFLSLELFFPEGGKLSTEGFDELEEMHVKHVPVGGIRSLLASVRSSKLESCTLSAQEPGGQFAEGEMCGALSHFTRWPGLEIVDLDLGGGVATWEDLIPLLSCGNVEDLSLSVIGSAAMVEDEHIELMAKAWPRLQRFSIRDRDLEPRYGDEVVAIAIARPVATLRGLGALSQHCPLLGALAISVDARGVGKNPPEVHGTGPSKVKELNLQWSVADESDVKDTGAFIAKMWPHQEKDARNEWPSHLKAESRVWGRIWKLVDKQLRRA